jgi:formiminoglutamase
MTDIIDPYHFTAGSAPLLISIPHAGTQLTPEVDNGLSDAARPLGDTDWHIPRLYDFAHALGASMLVGNYSRFVIDLNRPADDTPPPPPPQDCTRRLYLMVGTALRPA